MKTKVFYQGRQINGRFTSLKTALKRAIRFTVRWSLISAAGYAIFMSGAFLYSTSTVSAENVIVATSTEQEAPVLSRIEDCESGNGKPGSHTQFRNGQVLISINTNGTYDQGEYQINSIHNKDASNRGYNLATEEGNAGYAKYMFENLGTGDWSSSEHCWKR